MAWSHNCTERNESDSASRAEGALVRGHQLLCRRRILFMVLSAVQSLHMAPVRARRLRFPLLHDLHPGGLTEAYANPGSEGLR